MEDKTFWERIADALTAHGYDVYPPAIKNGECKEEYIVITQDGSSQYSDLSSEADYYTLLLYVPQEQYTRLAKLKQEIKGVVATELYPLLKPTGLVTPEFFDDTYNAHMVSIQYRNNVRNKHL